jgi:VWFA-related protein
MWISMCLLFPTASIGNAQSRRAIFSSWSAPDTSEARANISITTSLVTLPVNVTDAHGRHVGGLTREDFQVYENNQRQELTLFRRENIPVTVGLIVDHSGSMRTKLPNVIAAISAFAHTSKSQDKLFVVNFNDRASLEPLGREPFTNDPEKLRAALEAVDAQGRTALYDAVAQGLIHLQLSGQQKKALIVVSDGGDNASLAKRSQVLALARKSEVTIYSIVLIDPSGKEQNPRVLLQLSKETGGAAFFPRSQAGVMDIASQIAQDLRLQYVLGFTPDTEAKADSFRKLQVKVSAPDAGRVRVRTRSGYYCCQ